MGVWRRAVCTKWLDERLLLDHVLPHADVHQYTQVFLYRTPTEQPSETAAHHHHDDISLAVGGYLFHDERGRACG